MAESSPRIELLPVGMAAVMGGQSQGGAIYNQGQLQLRELVLAGNLAERGSTLPPGGRHGQGGALYTGRLAIIEVCALTSNIARGGRGGQNHGMGGGVYNEGTCSVTNSTFASNSAI